MSTRSYSFRLSNSQIEKANSVFEIISKEKSLSKGDCLEYILDKYNEMLLNGKVSPDEYIPPNINETLISVNCDYIEYLDETFYCLEKYFKTKKKDILGISPDEVKRLCLACKQGKADLIEKKIADERRKESFKKLENFLKGFITITEKGFISESYMCTCDAIDGRFIVSRNNKTLLCPLIEYDLVTIKDICMSALNPKTGLPPCKHLITLEHLVQISKEDFKEMNLDIPQIQYEEPEPRKSPPLSKEYKAKIEAEYAIIEEEDKLEIEKQEGKDGEIND